jgi:hypothetical protein
LYDMAQMPPGYATVAYFPRRNPQPPAVAPPPPPPQGTRPVIGAPGTKTGAPPSDAPLIVRPFIQVFHNVFG